MDYKPSKQIRNICKFHTCKYLLFFNLLFYIYSKIINMHLSFKFLRETPRKRVLSINPGNYLSRRNTEKFHRETPRNFAQTISFYLAYFAVFLREIKISRLPWLRRNAECVVIFLPGVYVINLGQGHLLTLARL